MKQILMIAALFISMGSQMANATEKETVRISKEAKRAFDKQFPGAHYAKWEQLEDVNVYMVRFGYNSKSLLAYIDDSGVLLATVRSIQPETLPLSVSERLKNSYKDFDIRLIEELTIESETSYLILLENEKSKVTVRVFANGEYQQLKKVKKKSNVLLTKK